MAKMFGGRLYIIEWRYFLYSSFPIIMSASNSDRSSNVNKYQK